MAFTVRLLRSVGQRYLSTLTHRSLYTVSPYLPKWQLARVASYQKGANLRLLSSIPKQVDLSLAEELDINNRTVFFGGCEAGTTEDTIKEYFSGFGEVKTVRIVKTFLGYSRNYGFVCFKDPEVADEVLAKKHVILDKDIDVRRTKKFRVVYVGGLPSHLNEKTIEDHFSKFGTIESVQFIDKVKIKSKSGYAFITFNKIDEARKALSERKQEIEGYEIEVKPRETSEDSIEAEVSDSKKLKVECLPFETTVEHLTEHFEDFGRLKMIDLLISSKRKMCVGILVFESLDGIKNALAKEDHEIEGCPVDVVRIPDTVNIGAREKAIYLENIAPQTTEETILNYFRTFGQIAKVHLLRDPVTGISEGCGVVKFRRPKSAEQFEKISIHTIDGSHVKVRRRGCKFRPTLALDEISGLNLGLSMGSRNKRS